MEEQFGEGTESSSENRAHIEKSPWWNPPRYDHDRFSDFMFGNRPGRKHNVEQEEIPHQHQNQTYIDYEQLMVSIDSLVESARNLKPLFLNIFPFIGKFLNKK